MVQASGVLPDDGSDPDAEDVAAPAPADRAWLVQCKRERSITPAKMKKHLAEIPPASLTGLYGIIFVAACDFSKTTRDTFLDWARDNGISEAYIWAKGELEDQLFQPKNDHLLFAYFGISLKIRRQQIKTEVRSILAAKRKCERMLEEHHNVLLRDASDERYPYTSAEDHKESPRGWRVRRYMGLHPRGLMLELYSMYAYLADDEVSWDVIESTRRRSVHYTDDPWWDEEIDGKEFHQKTEEERKTWRFWSSLPDNNQANLTAFQLVKFEDIIDIDKTGDFVFANPHIYVIPNMKFHKRIFVENVARYGSIKTGADPAFRIKFFPDVMPDIEPDDTPSR